MKLLFDTWTGRWVLLGIALFLGGVLTMIAWIISQPMGQAFGAAVGVLGGMMVLILSFIMGVSAE